MLLFNVYYFPWQVRASVRASSSDSGKDKDNDNDKDRDKDNDSDCANDQPQNTFISKYYTKYPPRRDNLSPLITEDSQESIATLVMDSGSSELHGNEGPDKGRVYYIDTSRRSKDTNKASAPGECSSVNESRFLEIISL